MKRLVLAVLAAVLFTFGITGQALAHAELASSTPAAGAKLTSAPTTVTLVLTEELKEQGSSFTVTNTAGKTVGTGKLDLNDLDHKTLTGTLDSGLTDGVYTVTWETITADDNGESSGVFTFGINVLPGPQPTAAGHHDEAAPTAVATSKPTAAATAKPTAAATAAPTSASAGGAAQPTPTPSNLPATSSEPSPWLMLLAIAIVIAAIGVALRQIATRRS